MEKLPRTLAWGLALVVVGASAFAYQLGKTGLTSEDTAGAIIYSSIPQNIPQTGYFTCLSSKDGSPVSKLMPDGKHDANCTVGFHTLTGSNYALNMSKAVSFDGNYSPTRKIWVLGIVNPAGTGDEATANFQYDGVIAVRAIVTNNK